MNTPERHLTPFVALEVSTALSGAGNGVTVVAFPWLVLELTGSASAAAAIGAVTLAPLLFTSLISGTLVDILGRRRVSVGSDLLSFLSVAAIPILSSLVGLSFSLLAVLAVIGATFDPAGLTARESMLPEAARAADLQLERANGIHEATWGIAYIVGPGVGGILIALVGARNAFWATAVFFILSALLMFAVRVPGAGRPLEHGRLLDFWPATREGLVFLWREPVLRSTAVMTALLVGFWLPVEGVLLPVYFQARHQPGGLGAVLASISAGAVIGALVYAAAGARMRRRTVLNAALLGMATAVVGMAFLPPLPALLAFGFVSGLMYGPINPIKNVALQQRTPDRLRGRVLGLSTSIAFVAGPAGYLLVGPLIDRVGLRESFLILAGGLLAVAVGSFAVTAFKGLDEIPDETIRAGR